MRRGGSRPCWQLRRRVERRCSSEGSPGPAIPGDGGVVDACYGKVGGVVPVIDTAKREKCPRHGSDPISWNQQGAPGAPWRSWRTCSQFEGPRNSHPAIRPAPSGRRRRSLRQLVPPHMCAAVPTTRDGEAFSGTFTSPNGVYSMTVTDAGVSHPQSRRWLLRISGSSVNVTADNINIDATQNASVTAGSTISVTSGADTSISTGDDLTAVVADHTSINSGSSTALGTSGLDIDSAGPVSVSSGDNLTLQEVEP